MGTGYVRNDTANNIADGNIINASDLDGEFDAVQSAFNNSSGHTHDGTAGEGAPIETIGPSQDVVATASVLRPKTDNTVDLGTTSLEYKDLFLDGTAHIDTLDVDENASITGTLGVTGTTTLGTANITTGTITTADINGGNIDGTIIGATTAAAITGTTITGTTITGTSFVTSGDMTFGDNDKAIFGAGSDLQIYHDGAHSRLKETGTGSFYFDVSNSLFIRRNDNSALMASFETGIAKLYYENALKLATTSTGIDVTGTVTADGLTVDAGASDATITIDAGTAGVSSADAKLQLIGSFSGSGVAGYGNIYLDVPSGGKSDMYFQTAPSGGSGGQVNRLKLDGNGDISFYEDTGTTPKFFWDASAEYLGLGTTTPDTNLHVYHATRNNVAVFESGDADVSVYLRDGNSTSISAVGIGASTDDLTFRSGNAERMRIDSSGMVNAYYGISVDGGTIKLDGNYPTGTSNVALGNTALDSVTTGNYNTAIGADALTAKTTGGVNTAIGWKALELGATGDYNVGLGSKALQSSTGSYNTAVGTQALLANTTASNNTAVGYQSSYSTTTGFGNASLGYKSMYSNTASSNTAMGWQSLLDNTSGAENVAFGHATMQANTTGGANAAFGQAALDANTTGSSNTAIGKSALGANTTASHNTAVGRGALFDNTEGASNTAVGRDALANNTTASQNTSVGYESLYTNTTGVEMVAVGYEALRANTTAHTNHAFGYRALKANTTGASNVAVGHSALTANTTASNNTAVGYQAGYSNTTGANNTALGWQAAYSTTTSGDNTALGNASLYANTTGASNTAVGRQALRFNTTASNNTAVGYQAGYATTTGLYNTYIGYKAGITNTTSNSNTFVGVFAGEFGTGNTNTYIGESSGYAITTGSKNTILGKFSGNQGGLDIRTSSNNIVLSDGDGNPRVYVNSGGQVSFGTFSPPASRKVAIENTAYPLHCRMTSTSVNYPTLQLRTAYATGGQTATQIDFRNGADAEVGKITSTTTSTAYNTTSDHRLKENVVELTGATTRLKQLEPKRFNFIADADTTVDGFIAHEVQAIVPEAITGTKDEVDADGNPVYQGIDQAKLVPLLVATIKELEARITALENA